LEAEKARYENAQCITCAAHLDQEQTGWLPTSANINALPDPIRGYIHDLETRADPAGELVLARDAIRQLQALTQEQTGWQCGARAKTDPPQDCGWPTCGCDPYAQKVLDAISEQTGWREMLKRLVMAWDTDDDMEFLAATFASRKALGLKLADAEEEATDQEVLLANGYDANGNPAPPLPVETLRQENGQPS